MAVTAVLPGAEAAVAGEGASRLAIRDRIRQLKTELAALEQQERAELVAAIAGVVGPHVVFSAKDLFAHTALHSELAAAFADAGIRNVRQLGKRLRQLRGDGLERVGADDHGALWLCR